MADVLFIQPWDRPWVDAASVAGRQRMFLSRAMFEVCAQVPKEYTLAALDLNVALRSRGSIEDVVAGACAEHQPRIVLLSMSSFVIGEQIARIIAVLQRCVRRARVVLGGSVTALIHELPLRWWPSLAAVYCGHGREIPTLITACDRWSSSAIPGVSWSATAPHEPSRGAAALLDRSTPEELYTAHGRIAFDRMRDACRAAALEPIGLLEMSRGCTFSCAYCSLNRERLGWMQREPGVVIAEARWLVRHGITSLQLIDPTLGIDRAATGSLFEGIAAVHTDYPAMRLEVLTRPEYVTSEFAHALRRAGVVRCAIGMETMDAGVLAAQRKSLRPTATTRAIRTLAADGIETKLYHMVFPHRASAATIRFLGELADDGVPFIVQSSFLRPLPDRNAAPDFLAYDHTVYDPARDGHDALMEWMLVNLAFPSMDVAGGGDPELRHAIARTMRRGKPLSTLFARGARSDTVRLTAGTHEIAYAHQPGQPAIACCSLT